MTNKLTIAGKALAFHHRPAQQATQKSPAAAHPTPGVLFCGGFRSSMQGIKARWFEDYCQARNWPYTRFDYRGHGQSSAEFADCCIADWLEDTVDMLDHVAKGPQILIGSSMGLWLALLATLKRPGQVKAVLGIAGAVDFTEKLIWQKLSAAEQAQLKRGEAWMRPNQYDDEAPYPINLHLIEGSRKHLLTHQRIGIDCPVRLLHGDADGDVPWQLSQAVLQQLSTSDATLTLIKHADHRLSSPQQLLISSQQLQLLYEQVSNSNAATS